VPKYSFTLNGKQVEVDAPADLSVLWALRDKLGLTGPKYGCGINVCKACTSHLDGASFNPCVTNLRDVEGREVTTIEGLADGDVLHPVQEAWLEQDVAQCGFCQPGQIMAAVTLLARTSTPTDAEIDEIDNVCRCGTYFRIREAIKSAAVKLAAPPAAAPPAAAPPAAAGPAGPSTTSARLPSTAARTLPATGTEQAAAIAAAVLVAGALAARAAARGDEPSEPQEDTQSREGAAG
jgi:isoquinoline 1-oxidoreductase alpha subunit